MVICAIRIVGPSEWSNHLQYGEDASSIGLRGVTTMLHPLTISRIHMSSFVYEAIKTKWKAII